MTDVMKFVGNAFSVDYHADRMSMYVMHVYVFCNHPFLHSNFVLLKFSSGEKVVLSIIF